MEYDFINDPITGNARANFSLDQQVFGPWLELEIGNNQEKIAELEQALEQVSAGKAHEVIITGLEYHALITRDEVTISANANVQQGDDYLDLFDNELSLDQTSQGQCGFEDFRILLQAWLEFIH